MSHNIKKIIYITIISTILTVFFIPLTHSIPLTNFIHWNLYDRLQRTEYKLRPTPSAINDILLVTIDNETLNNMPQRWPYARSVFAKVIQNLKKAGAGIIAFDFIFYGNSSKEEDGLLERAILSDKNKVILGAMIDEKGQINISTTASLSQDILSGIATNIQDSDGITRRSLTYLVNHKEPSRGFLSWGMQVLKAAKNVDLSTFVSDKSTVSFFNNTGEKWIIPVDHDTKSFLIHFRAHTINFNRLSFYRVFNDDFDTDCVKGKIILVGLLSSLLGDLHNTSLGFLPGITLNANAFLAIYAHDFLKNVPAYVEEFAIMIGVVISTILASLLKTKKILMFTILEILLFFALSYIILLYGYIWNYFLFPVLVLLCPFLSKKIYLLIRCLAGEKICLTQE